MVAEEGKKKVVIEEGMAFPPVADVASIREALLQLPPSVRCS